MLVPPASSEAAAAALAAPLQEHISSLFSECRTPHFPEHRIAAANSVLFF